MDYVDVKDCDERKRVTEARLRETWLERAALGACIAVSVACLFAFERPPMNDASSHTATGLIARRLLAGDAFTAEHYHLSALPLPYWATTLLMVPLLQLFEPVRAFQVIVALYLVALPLSFRYLLRVAAPSNVHLAIVGCVVAFNWAYYLGEINFLLGQPLVLVGYALYLQLDRGGQRRTVAFAVVAIATYLCHLFALVALMVPVGLHLAVDVVRRRRPSVRRLFAGGVCGALFAAAAWFVLFEHRSDANAGEIVFDLSPYRLAAVMRLPQSTPSVRSALHPLLMAPLLGVLAIGAQLGRWRERIHGEMLLPCAAFAALTYFGPAGIQEALAFEDIGQRFALCAFLFGFGAVRAARAPVWRASFTAAAVAVASFHFYDAWLTHRSYDERARAVSDEVLAAIPRHQRVLPLFDMAAPTAVDMLLHRHANYIVVERDGYSPHVFARSGQQPLHHRYLDEYRPLERLDVSDDEWRFYDYVIVQTDQPEPRVPGLAEHAVEVARVDQFRAYRVAHPDLHVLGAPREP